MAFDIDMIKKVYNELPSKIENIRKEIDRRREAGDRMQRTS